jgi:hypothetical protein
METKGGEIFEFAVRRASDEQEVQIMAIHPTQVIKNLGWRRFFQLLAHLPSFLKLFLRLVKDPRVNLAPKLVVLGVSVSRPAYRSRPGFYSGLGAGGRRDRATRGLEAVPAPMPARSCAGTWGGDFGGEIARTRLRFAPFKSLRN